MGIHVRSAFENWFLNEIYRPLIENRFFAVSMRCCFHFNCNLCHLDTKKKSAFVENENENENERIFFFR